MTYAFDILLAIMAFLIGSSAALMGIGGGVFLVPALILLFGVPPSIAAGTSLLVMVFCTLSGTLGYRRRGIIDYRLGLVLEAFTVPGVVLGSFITLLVPLIIYKTLLGVFLTFVALYVFFNKRSEPRMLAAREGWNRKVEASNGRVYEYTLSMKRLSLGASLSFFVGMISGFFGVGGGTVKVPILILVLGMPLYIAIATSEFMVMITSIFGSLSYGFLGSISPWHAIPLILGIVVGAQMGVHLAERMSERSLNKVFAILLLIVGGILIVSAT